MFRLLEWIGDMFFRKREKEELAEQIARLHSIFDVSRTVRREAQRKMEKTTGRLRTALNFDLYLSEMTREIGAAPPSPQTREEDRDAP